MAKTALIVDDSASARLVLGRMLAEQHLAVDTAASGEEALDYLRLARPDVIFMDHLMPGMDGFQALEAIKENPATATIPVMMYTSQEGELYVGQARALGAFGVLPKQIEPVEVTKVLRALHLVPDDGADELLDAGAAHDLESGRVGELLEDMFRQQRSMLRDEIRKGYAMLSETAAQTGQYPTVIPGPRTRFPLLVVGTLVLGLGVAVFAYLYYGTVVLLQDANERVETLLQSQQEIPTPSDDGVTAQSPGTSAVSLGEVSELLQWGINQGGSYRFGETALDGERAQGIAVLADRLRNAAFTGTIVVTVHVGRYCMNFNADGVLVLPPADQLAEDCQQLGWSESEAQLIGEEQTLPFANTISLAARDEGIRIEVASAGSSEPTAGYPLTTQGFAAGEWNAIAARNHRVDVRIVPE